MVDCSDVIMGMDVSKDRHALAIDESDWKEGWDLISEMVAVDRVCARLPAPAMARKDSGIEQQRLAAFVARGTTG